MSPRACPSGGFESGVLPRDLGMLTFAVVDVWFLSSLVSLQA